MKKRKDLKINLPYSTGSSARCSVMIKRGGEEAQEEGDIYTQLIHTQLIPHCKAIMHQWKKNLKKEKTKSPQTLKNACFSCRESHKGPQYRKLTTVVF